MSGTPARKATKGETSSSGNDQHGPLAGKWLPAQEREALALMIEQLRAEYQPSTATQHIMIERIAMAMAKLRRLHEVEDAMHATARVHAKRVQERGHPRFDGMDSELAQAAAVPNVRVWSMLGQYQASLDREISRSIGELILIKGAVPGCPGA